MCLQGGHLHTLVSFVLRGLPDAPRVVYRREVLPVGGGGEVALDWASGAV